MAIVSFRLPARTSPAKDYEENEMILSANSAIGLKFSTRTNVSRMTQHKYRFIKRNQRIRPNNHPPRVTTVDSVFSIMIESYSDKLRGDRNRRRSYSLRFRHRRMLTPQAFPDTRPSLLGSLRDGRDLHSWRDFFSLYAPAVYRVARLKGASHSDADDIVQQVMLTVSSHIEGFRYDRDRGRFRDWVRQVTRNKIIDHHRKSKRSPVDLAVGELRADDVPTFDELWQQEWALQDVYWCLDQIARDISPRRMQAFRQYVLEGKPAQEVADANGLTVNHVYLVRHQVIHMIRKRLAELDGSELSETEPTE